MSNQRRVMHDPRRRPERHCPRCFDLPWRRVDNGKCLGCGELHEAEKIEPLQRGRSAVAAFQEW